MAISKKSKAVLVITGYWHVPEHYNKVISQLEGAGIRVICECLPTISNPNPPHKTIYDDIKFIQDIVAREVEAKTHLTVLCHSYGGMVASAALGKFAVAPNAADKGGVDKIIYMCAFVPSENQSLAGMFGGKLPDGLAVLPDKTSGARDAASFFYSDMSLEDSKHARDICVDRLPVGPMLDPIGGDRVAWRSIPSVYIVCEADAALPPEIQRAMVAKARAEGAKFKEYSIRAAHSPFLNMPNEVTEIILEVLETR